MGDWASTIGSVATPSTFPGGTGGTPPFVPPTGGGGGFLSQLFKWLPVAGLGFGTIGNILGNRARNQVLSSEMAQMKALEKLTPGDITAGITALQQPLSNNLIKSVGNVVQGQMAERGLAQAPGIFTQALAQGLAPYQLQTQQLAQDAFFKKLGLPIQARPSPFGPFPQQTNTSGLWQAIMSKFMKPGGAPTEGTDLPGGSGVYMPAEASIIQSIIGGPNVGGTNPDSGMSTTDLSSLLSFNPTFAGATAGGG